MGFDKHFYQDHCYMDDPTNDVGMNVEIIEDGYQVVDDNVTIEKPNTRLSPGVHHKQNNVKCETIVKSEGSKNANTYVYLPYVEVCTDHQDLLLHEDEKLVKPGDKFDTLEDFVQYVNLNAKRWCFYYKCSDSRTSTGSESYTYSCIYLKNKDKYKRKGMRKRNTNVKTDCPCKIKLRHLPDENGLTVVFVCNHHDHELSSEEFNKLQHGRRLPPYVKQEILDLLTLKVDKWKIKKYVENETGFIMTYTFFYTIEKNLMRLKYGERLITPERKKQLMKKMAVMDVMSIINEDNTPDISSDSQSATSSTIKQKPQVKRESTSQDTSLTGSPKRCKTETCSEVNDSEQNANNLQDSTRCEIQKNPWVSDQCVPVLPNRTALVDDSSQETNTDSQLDPETKICAYHIVHPAEITQENLNKEIDAIINGSHDHEVTTDNDIDNIAYETVVIDGNDETYTETEAYVTDSIISNDEITIHNETSQEVINVRNQEFDGTQDIIEIDHVQYLNGDDEQIIGYIDETSGTHVTNSNENGVHDVGIQTNRNKDTGQTLLPVFDVYMKDGNVTGFVINDNVINGLKGGVDQGVQTSEDIMYSDIQEIENEDAEIIQDPSDRTGETYMKHEYIHKYNIDQYMSQPNFPKYVDILAKETYTDVLSMFTNVYNETAMFKLTTTQKGKEGNTRIRYITHNGRVLKKKTDDTKREKLGKKLHSVFVLKEKIRMLKRENDELMKRNKYLEGVTLNLVDMV